MAVRHTQKLNKNDLRMKDESHVHFQPMTRTSAKTGG